MKYFVIVAGGGETSRANLEALMEDHYYANGAEGVLVLPIINAPTQAQVFAAQYAKDKNKDIVIFSNVPSEFPGIPPATVYQTDDPISDSAKTFAGEKVDAFILWSDEDDLSRTLLAKYSSAEIKCYDLTDGLTLISAVKNLTPAKETEFPTQELDLPKASPEEEDEEDEDYEDEDEDDEEYEESSEEEDALYFGVQSFIKLLAKAIAEEMKKSPKE